MTTLITAAKETEDFRELHENEPEMAGLEWKPNYNFKPLESSNDSVDINLSGLDSSSGQDGNTISTTQESTIWIGDIGEPFWIWKIFRITPYIYYACRIINYVRAILFLRTIATP